MLKCNKEKSNTKKDVKSREGKKIIVRVHRRVSKEQGARSSFGSPADLDCIDFAKGNIIQKKSAYRQ
jgi:hypothetical protein